MDQNFKNKPARFRPPLNGCVGKDYRLARAVEDCYREELSSFAAHSYRALLIGTEMHAAAALFEGMAEQAQEHFRLLGELVLALGGTPTLRTSIRVSPMECLADGGCSKAALRGVVSEALAGEHRKIDRLQILMGHTQDRVVRSVLDLIASDLQRNVERLQRLRFE